MKKKTDKLTPASFFLLIIPVFIFLYSISRGITLPYVGYNAWNFNTYSLIAKNYSQFGYTATKFAPIISVSRTIPAHPMYYLHHPQFLPIVESILFRIFGMNFWVGRLTVILFSCGAFLLLFAIARLMKGSQFAVWTMFGAALTPAFTVFGRMIDMEPLVIFFALLSIYFLLQYFESKKRIFMIGVIISIILGTFSDWPMVYFSFLLVPLLLFKKESKLAILVILSSILTETIFLVYIYLLVGNLTDLLSAILNRSVGELLSLPYWPMIWIATLGIRFILYYNPIFVLSAGYYLFLIGKQLMNRRFSEENLILSALFFLGLFYVLFFPEGSFGHAYWIIYFIPFFSFSSARLLSQIHDRSNCLSVIVIVCSVVFLFIIQQWKTKEVATNVWRYDLAKKADAFYAPFETIITNTDSPIDADLFAFAFSHAVQYENPKDLRTSHLTKYLYACTVACNLQDPNVYELMQHYESTREQSTQGEFLLFDLSKPTKKNILILKNKNDGHAIVRVGLQKMSPLRMVYNYLKGILHAPQL